jgi:hypothetical protein
MRVYLTEPGTENPQGFYLDLGRGWKREPILTIADGDTGLDIDFDEKGTERFFEEMEGMVATFKEMRARKAAEFGPATG